MLLLFSTWASNNDDEMIIILCYMRKMRAVRSQPSLFPFPFTLRSSSSSSSVVVASIYPSILVLQFTASQRTKMASHIEQVSDELSVAAEKMQLASLVLKLWCMASSLASSSCTCTIINKMKHTRYGILRPTSGTNKAMKLSHLI